MLRDCVPKLPLPTINQRATLANSLARVFVSTSRFIFPNVSNGVGMMKFPEGFQIGDHFTARHRQNPLRRNRCGRI